MSTQDEQQRDDHERSRLLIFVERLVREGTPEPEIVRQVEELLTERTKAA
jgi:hypothetical protein